MLGKGVEAGENDHEIGKADDSVCPWLMID